MNITPTSHDSLATAYATELLQLTRDEAVALLVRERIGRLAVTLEHASTPLVRPVNYYFDLPSQSVVFRTGLGSKLHAALHAPMAAFEIDEIDPSNGTGWSVIVAGPIEAVTGAAELARLEKMLPEPWAPGIKHHMIRIRAVTVSGRRIVLARDEVPGSRVG